MDEREIRERIGRVKAGRLSRQAFHAADVGPRAHSADGVNAGFVGARATPTEVGIPGTAARGYSGTIRKLFRPPIR